MKWLGLIATILALVSCANSYNKNKQTIENKSLIKILNYSDIKLALEATKD